MNAITYPSTALDCCRQKAHGSRQQCAHVVQKKICRSDGRHDEELLCLCENDDFPDDDKQHSSKSHVRRTAVESRNAEQNRIPDARRSQNQNSQRDPKHANGHGQGRRDENNVKGNAHANRHDGNSNRNDDGSSIIALRVNQGNRGKKRGNINESGANRLDFKIRCHRAPDWPKMAARGTKLSSTPTLPTAPGKMK